MVGTSTESTLNSSPPHAYEAKPNIAGSGWPLCANNDVTRPITGTTFEDVPKFSLNCSTTGSITARLLMISISASACSEPALGINAAASEACALLGALGLGVSTCTSASAEYTGVDIFAYR